MPFVAIDAGNSQIVFGVLDEEKVFFSNRLKTDRFKTSDEYAVILQNLLQMHKMDPAALEGGIISSVVPSLTTVLQDAVHSITGKYCMVVGPGLKNGLRIRIDNPAQLGSDLVAEAVAAAAEYPKPILILDLGTATTVSVLDKKGAYRGGMIMPGTVVSLEALVGKTALLPHISLADGPSGVIGTNSHDCIVNGTIYGSAAMLDGVIERLSNELEEPPCVVATGGVAEWILPYCRSRIIMDKELLLKGLRIIYLRNRKV